MTNLPDIPGKSLVADSTKRAWRVASTVGAGAVTVGGFVAKRLRGHDGDHDGDDRGGNQSVQADPIAETPTAPPGANGDPGPAFEPGPERAVVKPQAAKPAPAKPKPAKPKPAPKSEAKPKAPPKPKAGSPKPKAASKSKPKAKAKKAPKPKAGTGQSPPLTTGTDAPPKPEVEPGNISRDPTPYRALSNPVVDPDETEYPDPYEKRDDPRDPVDPDGMPFGEEPHVPTGAESTSEPPPAQDPEVGDRAEPPKRENLDD